MCLAIPGKIIKIEKDIALVDYKAEKRKAKNIINAKVNDYVIVNNGFVIQKVSEKEALESLKAWSKAR